MDVSGRCVTAGVVWIAACRAPRPPVHSPFDVDDPRAQPGYVPPAAAIEPAAMAPAPAAPALGGAFRIAAVTADGLVHVVPVAASPPTRALAAGDVLVALGDRPRAARPAAARAGASVGVALTLTALGAGVDAAVPIAPRANVRVGFNAFALDRDYHVDGIDFAANLTLRSFTAYFDWFAFGGSFHVSPGVMVYNGNRASAVATVPGGDAFTLGDRELRSSALDPVRGTAVVEFERVAPAISIGWGNIAPRGARRWSIPVELGVVYTRAPTTTLVLDGTACLPDGDDCADVAAEPALQAAITDEEATLDARLARLNLLPIVSVGFAYSF